MNFESFFKHQLSVHLVSSALRNIIAEIGFESCANSSVPWRCAAFGAAAEHANLIYLDYIDCGPSEKIFQSKKFALQPELFKSQTSEPQQLFE